MQTKSILREKSFQLGILVVELNRFMKEQKIDSHLTRQFLRAGTAIGALIREAEFAQSKADFISKLSIALKEASETEYWIRMIMQVRPGLFGTMGDIQGLLTEIIKMLVSSVKTAKSQRI